MATHSGLTDTDLHRPVRFTQDAEPSTQRPGDQWLVPTTGALSQWNEGDDDWIAVASGTEGPPGASGGSTTALVVASADAPAAIKDAADYVCDGTADEVQINAALAALPSSANTYSIDTPGGGKVFLYGRFSVAAPIVNTTDHVELCGVYGHTIIDVVSGFVGTKVIDFNRSAQSRVLQFCSVHDIFVNGKDLLNASSGAITGFDLQVGRSRIDNLQPFNMTGDGLVYRGVSGGEDANSSVITRIHSYANGGKGFHAKDEASDNFMSLCHFHENGGYGAHFASAAWILSDSFVWGNLDYGLCLSGGASRYQIDNWKFEQNYGGALLDNGPSEIGFTDCDFNSNGSSPLDTGDQASPRSDIAIDGANPVEIKDCRWNPNVYSGQKSKHGIEIVTNGANGNVFATGGYSGTVANYTTGAFTNVSETNTILTLREIRNVNPQGALALSPTGSPMTITARLYDQFVHVFGGTVSGITKNSVAMGTSGSFFLRTGESIVVTYSSAPTLVRNRV